MKLLCYILVLGLLCLGAASSGAATLVMYDFNNLPTSTNSATGFSTLSLTGGNLVNGGQAGTAYTDTSGGNHVAGRAAAWNSGVNDPPANTIVLSLSTLDLINMALRYDYRATGTGPASALLEYRVNGGVYVSLGIDNFTRDSLFHTMTRDLSAVAAIQDQISVDLRWTMAAGTGTGTFSFDNLELSGTVIPEPNTISMGALAAIIFFSVRRRATRLAAI